MFDILRQFDMAYTHFKARLGEMNGISNEEGELIEPPVNLSSSLGSVSDMEWNMVIVEHLSEDFTSTVKVST